MIITSTNTRYPYFQMVQCTCKTLLFQFYCHLNLLCKSNVFFYVISNAHLTNRSSEQKFAIFDLFLKLVKMRKTLTINLFQKSNWMSLIEVEIMNPDIIIAAIALESFSMVIQNE